MNSNHTAVSSWLIINRDRKNMTQYDLADKTGITRGTISNYENGYITPSPSAMEKLARSLK